MTRSLEMVGTSRLIYWKVIFGHRNGSGRHRINNGVPGGYRNTPGGQWALMGFSGERRAARGCGVCPPRSKPNWFRLGGRPPPSFFSSPSFPCWTRKGGVLLLVGVGLSPWPHPCPLAGLLLLPPLYTEARGTQYTQVDSLSRVRCPSPQLHTSTISS